MDNIKQVTIHVDKGESRSGMAERLARIPGVTVDVVDLLSGDYAIADKVGVERKAASDFVASIMDGRLFGQLELLKTEYETGVVLIEGDLRSVRSAIEPVALDGALSYLALLSGIQVLQAVDAAHTAALLHRMALHTTHGLGYELPLRSGKPKTNASWQQYFLEGLPGVGPAMAKTLLAHFGSPHAVVTASTEDLRKVKGVGQRTVEKIHDVLGKA